MRYNLEDKRQERAMKAASERKLARRERHKRSTYKQKVRVQLQYTLMGGPVAKPRDHRHATLRHLLHRRRPRRLRGALHTTPRHRQTAGFARASQGCPSASCRW